MIGVIKRKNLNFSAVETHDFGSLYTKIPHQDLYDRIAKIIKWSLNGKAGFLVDCNFDEAIYAKLAPINVQKNSNSY